MPTTPKTPKKQKKKAKQPPSMASIIQSVRRTMRKDKGLNGELDRLPALTWLLLLKFLDDREQEWEADATLRDEPYRPVVDAPYRWRDWGVPGPNAPTGEVLLHFIEDEQTVRSDGTEGPGLLAYLRSLGGTPRRRVVAEVFEGVRNRMESGYLLRDVVAAVDQIHFTSAKEVQALGLVYESLLREMRDAAGDSGEFYTPRPVVRFMTERLDPRPGETVLDPACGTGGFLVAAYEHMRAHARTADDIHALGEAIRGQEAKSLPYLLCQMNLLLHGIEDPRVTRGNSLAVTLTNIGERDRVDVVLTNPPFGGEEPAAILSGFPREGRTRETALLFLQLLMRRLHTAHDGEGGGRAAVVVPNGILFADGTAAFVREKLLTEFNLHTVVRLPDGVFAPYTDIPTNLLFFERASEGTEHVWYYEVPMPDDRRKFSKTRPLRDEHLAEAAAWWDDRKETPQAWRYDVRAVLDRARSDLRLAQTDAERAEAEAKWAEALNLDRKNPTATAAVEHRPPEEIAAALVEREEELIGLLRTLKETLEAEVAHA